MVFGWTLPAVGSPTNTANNVSEKIQAVRILKLFIITSLTLFNILVYSSLLFFGRRVRATEGHPISRSGQIWDSGLYGKDITPTAYVSAFLQSCWECLVFLWMSHLKRWTPLRVTGSENWWTSTGIYPLYFFGAYKSSSKQGFKA